MTLRELIASDVDDVFMNTDEFADSCTYNQGSALEITGVIAIFHMAKEKIADAEGFLTEGWVSMALIAASDLPGITPRNGDRINRTVGSETWVYEVTPEDGSQTPAVGYDETGALWRLQVKRIE